MERASWQENEPMPLKDIEEKYPREWIAMQVTGSDEHYFPIEGRVIAHSLDREKLSETIDAMTSEEMLASRPFFVTRSSVSRTTMDNALELRAMWKLTGLLQ